MTPPPRHLGAHWLGCLRQMVESTDTRSGRAFDFSVQGLVIVSLVSFTISTQPHLSDRAVALLRVIEYIDVYPVTAGGRVFTVVVLLIGLGIVAVPTGLFASALSRVRADEPSRD